MRTSSEKEEQWSRLMLELEIDRCTQQITNLPRQADRSKDVVGQLLGRATQVGMNSVATFGYADDLTRNLYETLFQCCLDPAYHRYFQSHPWLCSQILRGRALALIVGGKLNDSLESAEILISSKQYFYDECRIEAVLMLGLYLQGIAAMHRGRLIESSLRFKEAIDCYERLSESWDTGMLVLAQLCDKYGMDIPTATLVYGALCLQLLGKLGEALDWNEKAWNRATGLNHPFTLAFCITFRAMFYKLRGADRLAHELATAGKTVSTQYDFAFYSAYATFLQGASQAAQGLYRDGIEGMYRGIKLAESTGSTIFHHLFDAYLMEAYQASEMSSAALERINNALHKAQSCYPEEQLYIGELLRIKGDILWHFCPEKANEAEWYLGEAFRVAYKQQALSQQLRAARDLSELWVQQGQRTKARDFLGSVVKLFPDDSCDDSNLKKAKLLLQRLIT